MFKSFLQHEVPSYVWSRQYSAAILVIIILTYMIPHTSELPKALCAVVPYILNQT